jgi:glycosyltransferase involved in cell wall biosynthesis
MVLMNNKSLSILIPVYNEARTGYQILDKLKETRLTDQLQKEIILVNDRSTNEKLDGKMVSEHFGAF